MQRLVRNRARCNGCREVIESTFRHDFVSCGCGATSVDGGLSYARRVFDPGVDYEELSEYEGDDDEEATTMGSETASEEDAQRPER